MRTTILVLSFSLVSFLHGKSGYADLIEKIRPGIVNIQATREARDSFGDNLPFFFNSPRRDPGSPRDSQSTGSGFLISSDGYIVTNRHVVEESKSLTVVLNDGKQYSGKLIGIDENLDVALLKIEAQNLDPLKLGDSNALRIGDEVLALGYPLQLGFTATTGILSGVGRDLRNDSLDLASYLQTDANITFGNSGGPLVNRSGEVIGINTMIISQGSTFGFAIPTSLFRPSIDQLKSHGAVRRGALGINVRDLNDNGRRYFKIEGGAEVAGITEGMPGEKAGLQVGDIIVAIDGKAIKNANELIATVSARAPGEKIQLELVDETGKKTQKSVVLVDRRRLSDPTFEDAASEKQSETVGLGFTVAPLESAMRRQWDLSEDAAVIIDTVESGSEADRQGLSRGMVLMQINGEVIENVKDLRVRLDKLSKGDAVRLKVLVPVRNSQGLEMRPNIFYLTKP